ncbi:MAG: YdeI/OmpD-associated family protein [Acidobacteriia bacterium]|nr:YdeI/OmpD-associated family protein [Terriglobia bacterium]
MIREGKMTPAGRDVVPSAFPKADRKPKHRRLNLSPPRQFLEALKTHPTAQAFFRQMAPSYQRQYLLWINMAQKEVTRARRVKESVALLAKGRKLGLK